MTAARRSHDWEMVEALPAALVRLGLGLLSVRAVERWMSAAARLRPAARPREVARQRVPEEQSTNVSRVSPFESAGRWWPVAGRKGGRRPRYQLRLPATGATGYRLPAREVGGDVAVPGGIWPQGRCRRLSKGRSSPEFNGFQRGPEVEKVLFSGSSGLYSVHEAEQQVCFSIDRIEHSCRDGRRRS